MSKFFLRLTCFVFGHGEIKQNWRSIGDGVQESYNCCVYCGGEE